MAKTKYVLAGATAARPKVVSTVGFEFYNTTFSWLEVWNGTIWVPVIPNASTTVKGTVNQSATVANVLTADCNTTTSPVATQTAAPDAIDLATALVLLNDLKARYNIAVTLLNEVNTKYNLAAPLNNDNKKQLNLKFAADRTSGQQAP